VLQLGKLDMTVPSKKDLAKKMAKCPNVFISIHRRFGILVPLAPYNKFLTAKYMNLPDHVHKCFGQPPPISVMEAPKIF